VGVAHAAHACRAGSRLALPVAVERQQEEKSGLAHGQRGSSTALVTFVKPSLSNALLATPALAPDLQ